MTIVNLTRFVTMSNKTSQCEGAMCGPYMFVCFQGAVLVLILSLGLMAVLYSVFPKQAPALTFTRCFYLWLLQRRVHEDVKVTFNEKQR